MSAKSRFTAQDIIGAAFHIVQTQGAEKCSARAIAGALRSSTMPIYSCIKSMKDLQDAIVKKAIDLLIEYETQTRTGITALDMGIGYILFAKREHHLFRMLFFSKNMDSDTASSTRYREYAFDTLMERLSDFEPMEGLTPDEKRDILYKMWIFNHGLAVLLNNAIIQDLDEQEITRLLLDTGLYVMEGVRTRDVLYGREDVKALVGTATEGTPTP